MTYTPTNRPVPSDAPEDLYFNSALLDQYVNGSAPSVTDRNGVSRKTLAGVEIESATALTQLAAPDGAEKVSYGGRTVAQKLADMPSLEDYGSSAVDGVTDNQDRWAAAAAANQGGCVWVPANTYVSSASITGFHNVDWLGPGLLKRGSQTFSIDQFGSVMNTLFVSTTGSSTNDGLSSAQAMLSVNAAVGIWGLKYAAKAKGPWKVKIAAGQYNESVVAQGFQSNKEIFLEGEYDAVNEIPLTVLDGASGATNSGIIFTTYGWVNCKWILCRNFGAVGAGGFNIGNYGRMTIDTCHSYNNNLVGFSAAQAADLRIVGKCKILLAANSTGITYYRQCTGSWSDASGLIEIDGQGNAATTGILCRDNSYVVAGSKFTIKNTTAQAVWLRRHSYLEVRDYEITNNNIGFDLRDESLLAPNGGTQLLSGNTQDYSYRNFSLPWDTPSNMLIGATGPSVQAPSSGIYAALVSSLSQTGLQFLTDAATSTINIDFNKKGSLVYAQADNSLRVALNNADAYRFATSAFFPTVDNAKTLGGSTFRWSTVYAGTGTINTSDERCKQQIKPIDEACLRAWAKVEYAQYKFNDAVESKGDDARWHFGLIAQRVKEAFESEGLNAFDYGILCYDEWGDSAAEYEVVELGDLIESSTGETLEAGVEKPLILEPRQNWVRTHAVEGKLLSSAVKAGDRFGVRYDEALALECAYLRSQFKKAE